MPISRAKRKAAAKKAALTRKRNQNKRRTAAKKAARTRKTKRISASRKVSMKRSPV